MKLQQSLLSAATAAVLGIATTGAQAGIPASAAYSVYIDGGSAVGPYVAISLINEVCVDNGNIDLYEVEDEEFVLNCDLPPAFGSGNVNFVKRAGSAHSAVVPLSAADPVSFPDPGSIDGTFITNNCDPVELEETGEVPEQTFRTDPDDVGTETVLPIIDGVDFEERDCDGAGTTMVAADFGISEVDEFVLVGNNAPAGEDPYSAAVGTALTSVGGSDGGVGGGLVNTISVVATKSLFQALQAGQFGEAYEQAEDAGAPTDEPPEACFPGGDNYLTLDGEGVPFGESLPCLPTLTKAEIMGLITGTLEGFENYIAEGEDLLEVAEESNEECDATPVDGLPDNGNCEIIATLPPGTDAFPFLDKVHYCRHARGTGTDALVNTAIANVPCTAGATQQTNAAGVGGLNVTLVGENSSEVAACLDDLENGTNNSGLFSANVNSINPPGVRATWGVGFMSTTENTIDADDGETRADLDGFRYVRYNRGGTPSNAAVWQGDYELFAESRCHRRANNTFVSGANAANIIAVFDELCSPDPIAVARVGVNFEHLWAEDEETNVAWALNPDGDPDTGDAECVFIEDEPGEFECKYDIRNPTVTQVKFTNACLPGLAAEDTEIDLDED